MRENVGRPRARQSISTTAKISRHGPRMFVFERKYARNVNFFLPEIAESEKRAKTIYDEGKSKSRACWEFEWSAISGVTKSRRIHSIRRHSQFSYTHTSIIVNRRRIDGAIERLPSNKRLHRRADVDPFHQSARNSSDIIQATMLFEYIYLEICIKLCFECFKMIQFLTARDATRVSTAVGSRRRYGQDILRTRTRRRKT